MLLAFQHAPEGPLAAIHGDPATAHTDAMDASKAGDFTPDTVAALLKAGREEGAMPSAVRTLALMYGLHAGFRLASEPATGTQDPSSGTEPQASSLERTASDSDDLAVLAASFTLAPSGTGMRTGFHGSNSAAQCGWIWIQPR